MKVKRPPIAGALVVLGLAALTGALAWRSRGWPLIHDAPLMHYIAWRIGEGAVPYRDLFDMNFPGVYLLHGLALRLFGVGDAGWRAFDLAWLAAASLAAVALAAPWGRLAAAGAGLFFAAYHLAAGAWQTGQRDFLLCPFLLLAALGVARWAERPAERTSLAWGGLALGAGITVKPHAGLFAAALLVLVAVVARGEGRPVAAPVAVFAAALAAPALAVVVWLAAAGALPAWYEIVVGYLVPLYSRLGRPERWTFYRCHVWIPIAGGAALSLASAVGGRRFAARHAVVAAGLGYGVAHFVGQGKGWEYHLYPLAAFAAVALFAELPRLLAAGRLAALPLLASIVAAATMLAVKGVEAGDPAWIAAKERRVQTLVADLDGRLAPGDFVQVLDTTEGGIHALLRLRAVQPTRFIYDFHFYHDIQTRTVQRLRAEFLAGFDAHPPKFVVLFERGWPVGGYERIDAFPGLRERLSAYRVDRRRDGYIVYAR
jgi:Dolichyl-phosphate-mannose-protein mannosyltransferase